MATVWSESSSKGAFVRNVGYVPTDEEVLVLAANCQRLAKKIGVEAESLSRAVAAALRNYNSGYIEGRQTYAILVDMSYNLITMDLEQQ